MGAEPWGLYPPEINSGRYDAGIGPATWFAGAVEWAAFAGLVAEAQAALGVQVGSITGQWEGLASQKTSAAAVPFITWLHEMGGIATLNAQRNFAVVQAYATGRAAMVPTPVIIANRIAARTAQVLGAMGAVNTEMVRLEIEYASFWTHNAGVMTSYDAAVTAATAPTPIPPPPPLVVDAVPGGGIQGQLQNLAQQAGGANPMGMGRSMMQGIPSQYAGPSLNNSSSLARVLGSGAGTGAAFGGRGASMGGGGAGTGARGAGGGMSGGLSGLLTPPLTAFNAPNMGVGGGAGSAFGGVQNAASVARPAAPMMPPMGRGSQLQKDVEERDRETIIAADQEFADTLVKTPNEAEKFGEEISVPAHLR